jgi:hypothetical protein
MTLFCFLFFFLAWHLALNIQVSQFPCYFKGDNWLHLNVKRNTKKKKKDVPAAQNVRDRLASFGRGYPFGDEYLFGDTYLFSILPNQQRARSDFGLILYMVNYGRVGKCIMRKSKRCLFPRPPTLPKRRHACYAFFFLGCRGGSRGSRRCSWLAFFFLRGGLLGKNKHARAALNKDGGDSDGGASCGVHAPPHRRCRRDDATRRPYLGCWSSGAEARGGRAGDCCWPPRSRR